MNEQVEAMRGEYTQGICMDGAAILCDGTTLTIEEVISRLRNTNELLDRIDKLEKQLNHSAGDVKEITDPDDLVAGKYYFLVSASKYTSPVIERLKEHHDGTVFFREGVLATKHHPQAFARWRIFGAMTVPEHIKPLKIEAIKC